jgi:hypothetical protein
VDQVAITDAKDVLHCFKPQLNSAEIQNEQVRDVEKSVAKTFKITSVEELTIIKDIIKHELMHPVT